MHNWIEEMKFAEQVRERAADSLFAVGEADRLRRQLPEPELPVSTYKLWRYKRWLRI
ncbi:hypothetical protein QUA41_28665 [Microcoleus sp. Pol11C1]|uniref:hypothetical protein n=1 Tax=unclassified Microcoleus TaxID=2642155 RepID=UPI002FD5F18D